VCDIWTVDLGEAVAVCCSAVQVVAGRCGLGDGGCVTLRWYSW